MIYLAGDNHGYQAMEFVMEYLGENEIEYVNLGVRDVSEKMKLGDMIPLVVEEVLKDRNNFGILSCGTGIGVEIGANKFSGIRACLAVNAKIAEWSKVYDKCNVLCLIGWDTTKEKVYLILDAWFQAEYDGDEGRLKMFEAFDACH